MLKRISAIAERTQCAVILVGHMNKAQGLKSGYRDENGKSIDQNDVYFVDGSPLDTTNVSNYLSVLCSLSLTEYVSYNVTTAELSEFGLDEPNLTVELAYIVKDSDGNEADTGSLTVHISQNPEAAAYDEAVQKNLTDLPDVTCYVRVGQSQIVYKISQDVYDQLTDVSYSTMRHQSLFTADFDTVTSIDVVLNGENYTFTYNPPEDKDDEDAEGAWTYNGEEFDIYNLKTALRAISASSFTEETPTGQEEISLTVHLDNIQQFIPLVWKYTDLQELTPYVLNELIEKIVVHEKAIGPDGVKTQQVDIYYKFIGLISQKAESGCSGEVTRTAPPREGRSA